MVEKKLSSSQGGNTGHPLDASTIYIVVMCGETIKLMTRSKTYDTSSRKTTNKSATDTSSTSSTPPYGPIQIEKIVFESIFHPPKSMI
jgi:hypothetical protein